MLDLGPSPYTDPGAPADPPSGASSPFTSYTTSAAPPPYIPSAYAAAAAHDMLYELRPLSLGEILDRTFALYRRRFWLFAGLSTFAAAVSTISSFVQLTYFAPKPRGTAVADPSQLFLQLGVIVLASLVYLCAYGITQAATVSALTAVYLGEETSISIAFRGVRRYWFRYVLIVLWQSFSAMWLPLVLMIPAFALLRIPSLVWVGGLLFLLAFASLVYAFIAYIRNSLGIAASTVEGLKVRASMRRSKVLVAGHKARVFAIFLLLWALGLAVGIVVGLATQLTVVTHGAAKVGFEVLSLLLTFLTHSLVAPVGAIALAVFYIDERVRKEGFDVELLMLRGAPPPPHELAPEAFPSPYSSELL
jgi:hypothetical protein